MGSPAKPMAAQRSMKLQRGRPPKKEEASRTPVIKNKVQLKKDERMEKALGAAKALRARGLKRPSIENNFSAASSKDSKNSKRKTIAKFLEELKGNRAVLPLDVDVLKGLASVLQEANYQAGDGYLVEAKLWRVEEGHPWTDQLDRVFKLCKRALVRGQGPRKKALEVTAQMRANPNALYFVK